MRKIVIVLLAAILAAGTALAQEPQEQPAQHAYKGLKKCVICHKGEKKGKIYEKWQETAHANAYAALASDEAKAVYKEKMGSEGNPQQDAACLKCHTTGYGTDPALATALTMENGVTCEACHGPGADYAKMSVMKDREAAVAAGLNPDPKTACVTCHNEESPTYKPFKFEEYYPKIEHHKPAAK